jgi:hypothetical protein
MLEILFLSTSIALFFSVFFYPTSFCDDVPVLPSPGLDTIYEEDHEEDDI